MPRQVAAIAVVVLCAGMYQVLRVSSRPVTSFVLYVPAYGAAAPAPPPTEIRVPRSVAAAPPTTAPRPQARPVTVRLPPTAPAVIAPAPSAPPPARPPAPGAYTYRYTVDQEATTGTVTVAMAPGGRTETEDVGGTRRVRTVMWSPGAATVAASDYGSGPCRWQPGLTAWALPLKVGQRWQTTSRCTVPIAGSQRATIDEAEDARVDGYARMTLSERPVQVWTIERHTLITEAANGVTATTETQSTELFAPAYGLVVYRAGRTASPNPDGTTTTTTSTVELTALP